MRQEYKRGIVPAASFLMVLLLCIVANISEIYAAVGGDVIVRQNKLFVNGEEFFVKGFNYSPEPRGQSSMSNGVGGGGLCSNRLDAFGKTVSACAMEDYFDSYAELNWESLWRRDFEAMRKLGVNTVRVYLMNPISYGLMLKYPNMYPNADIKKAPDHRRFLDVAHEYGIKVMVPLVTDEALLIFSGMDKLYKYIEGFVDRYGDHPALLTWVTGNELRLYNRPELRRIINKVFAKTRAYMKQKWNRIIPVTSVDFDLEPAYQTVLDWYDIDIYCANAGYRGTDFRILWDGNPATNFLGWRKLSEIYRIPIMVSEFGMHNGDDATAKEPDWFNKQWKSIVDHKKDGCIGGLFFEWSDEPTKPVEQRDMGCVKYVPATDPTSGKTSLEPGVRIPDVLVEKPIYQTMKDGYASSSYKNYNFNADVWALTGTTKLKLSDVPPDTVTRPPLLFPIPEPGPEDGTESGGGGGGSGGGGGGGCTTVCNNQCYDASQYDCSNGVLCPKGLKSCGGACYSPSQYHCVDGKLVWGPEVACAVTCPEGKVPDSNCNCVCKTGTSEQSNINNEKRCTTTCPSGKKWNQDWSKCVCTNTCQTGQLDENSCQCVVSSPEPEPEPSTGMCVGCPATDGCCNKRCYNKSLYDCTNGVLCPKGMKSCAGACYNPEQYGCSSNNQLYHL